MDQNSFSVESYQRSLPKDEQLKNQIVATASKLFQQYGLFKTTMEDIAKKLGKGKSTLYHYYKSKDQIFSAVIDKELEEILEIIEARINSVTTASEKLCAYIDTMGKILKTKANLYKIVKGELLENAQLVEQIRSRINKKEIDTISSLLCLGQKNHEFILLDEKDIDIYSSALVSALRSICIDLIGDETNDTQKRFDLLQKILIRGLQR